MATSFTIKGVKVTMWEKSFKVDGMSSVVFLGHKPDKEVIAEMVEAIVAKVEHKAHNNARGKLVEHVGHVVRNMIGEYKG